MNVNKLVFIFLLIFPFYTIAQKTATLIYIDQYKEIAISEMKRTGIPASITLAQGIIESNSGESNLALNFKNHFGIKCKNDWKGETTYQDDDSKMECFRVYPNAAASFKDHSNFLKTRPNYAPLFELDPVDDSAWAYGLKKAGYATAPDYPKKLLKVINDFELSQYNFPELEIFDNEEDTLKIVDSIKKNNAIQKVDTTLQKVVPIQKIDTVQKMDTPEKKDTSTIATTVINYKYLDTIQLSSVNGVKNADSIKHTAPNAIQGIGNNNKVIIKDSSINKDSVSKKNTKPVIDYPKGKFKANQLLAIYAKKGSSFLDLASTYQIPLFKLYLYNDLDETDLVNNDQILYLVPKRKEVSKKVHTVVAGENLYDISQMEGIQLDYLKQYNLNTTDKNLVEGTTLFLFKTNSITTQSNPPFVPIQKIIQKPKIKDTLQKDSTKKKTFDFIKNISAPQFLKRKKNN